MAQIRRVAGGVHEPPESVGVIEDGPTDNGILECALAASARLVVTRDKKHLLALGSFEGVFIIGLEDFLSSLCGDQTYYSGSWLRRARVDAIATRVVSDHVAK